jgi:putative transposase
LCDGTNHVREWSGSQRRDAAGAADARDPRRPRVVGAFPDGKSALMLVAARLRHVAGTRWGAKRYLQMNRLAEIVAIA